MKEKGIKHYGFGGANVPDEHKSETGWPAHSMDFQAAEHDFSHMKPVAKYLIACLKPEQRTAVNQVKCLQRAYELISQVSRNKKVNKVWQYMNECKEAKGDYCLSFLKRN